jgi:Pentapeptide repeats (8 copies)
MTTPVKIAGPELGKIEGPELAGVRFPDKLAGQDMTNGIFQDISGKGAQLEGVDFSFSVFVRAYFHQARFIDCKFTGCRFQDCNFREAAFLQCDFKYAFFDKTIVPTKQICASAPEWPNVRRYLMQNLRANAESIGDVDAQRAFIREEMKARREHLRRARLRQEPYYANKYAGWQNWLSIRWQSIWLWLDRNLLGYGEHIGRAVIGSCFLLLIIAFVQFGLTVDYSKPLADALLQLLFSARYVMFLLLDIPDTRAQEPIFLAVMIVVLRYLLIGLLVSALFRKLSHR